MPALVVLLLVLAACAPPETPSVTTGGPSTTTVVVPPPAPEAGSDPSVPPRLASFPVIEVELGGDPWLVAVADTPERRAQGLMGVQTLGELDGMLFVFPEETRAGFWMKDTLIPLDIAFFAADGSLVEVLRMDPCEEDPCPTYRPRRSYRWALEASAGRLSDLGDDGRLAIPGG